jgi:hypothetical protein
MTLVKSKIHSLAWLKSAIYISVVGGVMLSSTPALSAYFVFPPRGEEDSHSFIVREDTFLMGGSRLEPLPGVSPWWDILINITRTNGGIFGKDTLTIDVDLKHIAAPHRGDKGSGSPLTFKLYVDSGNPQLDILSGFATAPHAGINHRDSVRGKLTRKISSNSVIGNSDIDNWTLEVDASHVPEPTTIFGSALALGVGGWLKRKKSTPQNKAKSQA